MVGIISHTSDIKHGLERELSKTFHDIVIISAFVKLEALKYIDQLILSSVINKTLVVRFRLEDIISGSTDLELFDFCKSNHWRMFINFDLHSKILMFDKQRVIVGSANITPSGLGLKGHQNIESIATLNASLEEINEINKLVESSYELDEYMYALMKENISNLRLIRSQSKFYWDDEIKKIYSSNIDFLWTTDLFFSRSPKEICKHDIEILELKEPYDLNDIRRQFLKSKPFSWLKRAVKDEIYFGQLTAKLHDSLLDDPKPYRRDVKTLLSDLLNWVEELNIEDIVIDKPNYSQRIRVIS